MIDHTAVSNGCM